MSTANLLTELDHVGVALFLADGVLRYKAPRGALTPELRRAIKLHRIAIIHQLSRQNCTAQHCPVCDRRDWIDEPSQDGRIRTVCGRCGKLIGYRPQPAQNSAPSDLRFVAKEGN